MKDIVIKQNEVDQLLQALRTRNPPPPKDPLDVWLEGTSEEPYPPSLDQRDITTDSFASSSLEEEEGASASSEDSSSGDTQSSISSSEMEGEEDQPCLPRSKQFFQEGKTYTKMEDQHIRANKIILVKSVRCVVEANQPTLIECSDCKVIGDNAFLFMCERTQVRGDFYQLRKCKDILASGSRGVAV